MNFSINNRRIGDEEPVFIVAELSANHNQNFEIAKETIKAAKDAGADAIKLQTYTPDTITIDSNKEYFKIKHGTTWDGQTLYDLYKKAYTPWEWQPELKKFAEQLGLVVFSSPFDFSAVDFLEMHNFPAYKIASFEINDIPLIKYIASLGKPIILSTGVATLADIELAIKTIREAGNNKIALLKCTSAYPAPLEEVNLRVIPNMKKMFNVIVGLSDHTLGISIPIAATALGVKIIEKHFILDRTLGGPDAHFSLEPNEFKEMVNSVRSVEKALGKESYEMTEKMQISRKFMRSLFVVKDIKKGEILTKENVRSIRPNHGLEPKYLNDILGRRAKFDLEKGTPLSWELIE